MLTETNETVRVPDHVLPELVWDKSLDEFTSEGDDPWLAICRLHELPPVVWSTNAGFGQPAWIMSRYDLITEAFIDHEHFSALRPNMIADLLGEPVRMNPIEIDPPAHHGYRNLLNPYFTPKEIRSIGDSVRQACVELIAKFEDKGGCEFISEFAIPFPSYVFLDLMGMPREKLGDFIEWEDRLMRSPDPADRVAAAREIYAYLKEHKDRQYEHPSNEFLGGLAKGQIDGRPLDNYELMGMYYTLYVGGLDTVRSTVGWIMDHLATHPEMQERLRNDPELIPAAVEEYARAFSVVITHRCVAKDFVFHGVPMKKGDVVYLPLSLADRDPAAFENPHEIDIDRKPRHIAFATGVHSCLGVHLAKRELRIVIEEFLKRFRNIRIKPGEKRRYHTGGVFGVDYLPLIWD